MARHQEPVLTLGLRYEYNTPKTDPRGRTFSVIAGKRNRRAVNAPVGLVFPGDSGAPKGTNFLTRKCAARRICSDPTGRGKTSIRGFGVFYDILKGEDNLQSNGNPPFCQQRRLASGVAAGRAPLWLFCPSLSKCVH